MNAAQLVGREQGRHLARVEDVVDVLQERFVHQLCVGQQEHDPLALHAGHAHHRLDVLAPLRLAVRLAHL
jgi:hypothetical protein